MSADESLEVLIARLQTMLEMKFDETDRRFDKIEKTLDGINKKIDNLSTRVTRVEDAVSVKSIITNRRNNNNSFFRNRDGNFNLTKIGVAIGSLLGGIIFGIQMALHLGV